jgi:hypothetical protein
VSWADLDTLAASKPKSDGSVTLVARDDRTADGIAENQHLSTLVAIARVVRGRFALAEKHGGKGRVVYLTRVTPPLFLVEAVSAAGGIVFDGTNELVTPRPQSLTVQLDAAFCDLASHVRRRYKVGSITDALELREHELRRRPPAKADITAWWTTMFELTALTGELLRAGKPGKWIDQPNERLPFALDLGKGNRAMPGKLAQTVLETGGERSMKALLAIGAVGDEPAAASARRSMVTLVHRRSVPIESLTWELLVKDEVDTPEMPVIAYVDDTGELIEWPTNQGAPTADQRRRAIANIATEPVEIERIPLPGSIEGAAMMVVHGSYYATEHMLVPATMKRVAKELGAGEVLVVAAPKRGTLFVVDSLLLMADDELQRAFLLLVEKEYLDAPERDRISSEAIVYMGGPIGRIQSNFMDTRRALRRVGVDPDA